MCFVSGVAGALMPLQSLPEGLIIFCAEFATSSHALSFMRNKKILQVKGLIICMNTLASNLKLYISCLAILGTKEAIFNQVWVS